MHTNVVAQSRSNRSNLLDEGAEDGSCRFHRLSLALNGMVASLRDCIQETELVRVRLSATSETRVAYLSQRRSKCVPTPGGRSGESLGSHLYLYTSEHLTPAMLHPNNLFELHASNDVPFQILERALPQSR